MLAVSLNGNKLKPFVVFIAAALNGKVKKELNTYDKRSVYGVGPKGFSDTRIMVEWVNKVLKPYIEQHGGGKGSGKVSLLMMDKFKAHLTKDTRFGCTKSTQAAKKGKNIGKEVVHFNCNYCKGVF